ncbi:MAG: hypothetical protein Q4B26_12000 [Eubacteriales bacterium]|nr:hypothetical protein [Eubacteriales bacterium]
MEIKTAINELMKEEVVQILVMDGAHIIFWGKPEDFLTQVDEYAPEILKRKFEVDDDYYRDKAVIRLA